MALAEAKMVNKGINTSAKRTVIVRQASACPLVCKEGTGLLTNIFEPSKDRENTPVDPDSTTYEKRHFQSRHR